MQPFQSRAELHGHSTGVEGLLRLSDYQRRRIMKHMKGYRSVPPSRDSPEVSPAAMLPISSCKHVQANANHLAAASSGPLTCRLDRSTYVATRLLHLSLASCLQQHCATTCCMQSMAHCDRFLCILGSSCLPPCMPSHCSDCGSAEQDTSRQ